jgi:integrase
MASIQKRERTLKGGSKVVDWRVKYKDGAGIWRRQQIATKREAEKFAQTIGAAVVAGVVTKAESVTVKQAVDSYIETAETIGVNGSTKLERVTVEGYRQLLRDYVVPHIGAMKISALTTVRVAELRDDDLLKAGVSRDTTRRALQQLSSVCSYAAQKGWAAANAAYRVTVKRDKREKRKVQVPTDEEIKLLRKTAATWAAAVPQFDAPSKPVKPYEYKPDRWRVLYTAARGQRVAKVFQDLESAQQFAAEIAAQTVQKRDLMTRRGAILGRGIVEFALETGCRLSEIRGAPKGAYNREEKTFLVRQRVDRYNVVGRPKTAAGWRTIELSARAIKVIEECMALSPGDLIFSTATGKPYSTTNFYRDYWIPLLTACDLAKAWRNEETDEEGHQTKFGFHYLRHRHASDAIRRGIEPKELQAHLGHATIQITLDIYTHLFDDDKARRKRREKTTGDHDEGAADE